MSSKNNPPSVTLPTSDYYSILKMSNHAVVGVLRQIVTTGRIPTFYTNPIPEEHDSYCVRRAPDQVTVKLFYAGDEVYRCIFVPPAEY